MKFIFSTAILVSTMMFNSQAFASYFQTNCSNSDGTIRYGNGHDDNFVNVTARTYNEEGVVDTIVTLPYSQMNISAIETQELESSSWDTCEEGSESGIGYWRRIQYVTVKITNADGTIFNQNIVGVSADQTSIEARMLCEENGNSLTLCGQN